MSALIEQVQEELEKFNRKIIKARELQELEELESEMKTTIEIPLESVKKRVKDLETEVEEMQKRVEKLSSSSVSASSISSSFDVSKILESIQKEMDDISQTTSRLSKEAVLHPNYCEHLHKTISSALALVVVQLDSCLQNFLSASGSS